MRKKKEERRRPEKGLLSPAPLPLCPRARARQRSKGQPKQAHLSTTPAADRRTARRERAPRRRRVTSVVLLSATSARVAAAALPIIIILESPPAMSKAVIDGFAGGIGSLVALFATYPLKTVYTLQAIRAAKAADPSADAREAARAALRRHPLRALARAAQREAPVLYAGVRPAALETALSSALYFWLYSLLRQAVARAQQRRRAAGGGAAKSDADIGVLASLLVAALAGAGNQLVTTPAQVVTTQLQAIARRRRDLLAQGDERGAAELPEETAGAVVCALVRDGGVGALWKGLGPSLVLVVNPAVQYALYEWLLAGARKRKAAGAGGVAARGAPRRPAATPATTKLSATEIFLLSALAKIGATVVTYPMIVVKSRLQAQGCATGGGGGGDCGDEDEKTRRQQQPQLYRGTGDAVGRIWREEGVGGFFAGMRAKILQTALNAALMLTAKDYIYDGTAAVVRAMAKA